MVFTKMTSDMMTRMDETTTARVEARPTPVAPPLALYPMKQETKPMSKPKTKVFRMGGCSRRNPLG